MACFSICEGSSSSAYHPQDGFVAKPQEKIPLVYPHGIDDTFLQKTCPHESVRTFAQKFFSVLSQIIEPIKKIVIIKHIVQIVNLPIIVKGVIKKCMNFHNMTRDQKIDTGLNVCNSLREVGESVATFVVGLEAIKAIPLTTPIWALPFSAVISALSVVAIVCKIRTCIKVSEFVNSFARTEDDHKVGGKATLEGYKATLNLIEEKQLENETFIYDTFNVTNEKLSDLLVNIQITASEKLSSNNPEEVKEGQEMLEKAICGLKGRIKQNIVSSALAITASVLNIVGTTLLLALPEIPVGWAFLGLGVVVEIGRLVYHKIGEYQFAQAIGLQRSKWEWLTC